MAENDAKLPFRTVPEGVLKAHKDRMGEIDVRVRRLSDIQMIDGVDLMAMILEIEHYRSKPEPSNDLTKRLYGIAREYEEHNICTPGDEDRMVAAMREAADRLAFLERERAEQSKDDTQESFEGYLQRRFNMTTAETVAAVEHWHDLTPEQRHEARERHGIAVTPPSATVQALRPVPAAVRVNGAALHLYGAVVSYENVVELAGKPGATHLTVAYERSSGAGGTLIPGESVPLSDGMVFCATSTSNA